jgi:CRISPR-associated protein Csb1
VTLQLAALRLLRAGTPEDTRKLLAYLLGLALVAFTRPTVGFLRQGCNLVLDEAREPELSIVFPSGKRETFRLTHGAALKFAQAAAAAFGIGESKTVKFDTDLAKVETSIVKKKDKAKAKAQ